MTLSFTFQPATVSFGATQVLEIPGGHTNLKGACFATPPGSSHTDVLLHRPNLNWVDIAQNNVMVPPDRCSLRGLPSPWTPVRWDWIVPNHFRVRTETGNGLWFTNSLQQFSLEGAPNAGRSTVRKLGQFSTRSP